MHAGKIGVVIMQTVNWLATNQLIKELAGLKSPMVCMQQTHGNNIIYSPSFVCDK